MTDKKVCPKCGVEKLANEFYSDTSRKSGLHPWCKDCKKEAQGIDPSSSDNFIGIFRGISLGDKNRVLAAAEEKRILALDIMMNEFGLPVIDGLKLAQTGAKAFDGLKQRMKLLIDDETPKPEPVPVTEGITNPIIPIPGVVDPDRVQIEILNTLVRIRRILGETQELFIKLEERGGGIK